MHRLTLFLVAAVLISQAGWTNPPQQTLTLRVGVYENAPKIYTEEDGTVSGFWPDLIRYIAAEEGWEIVWVHGTWDECLVRLENNDIDVLPDTGWTEERSLMYAFSQEPVLISWTRLYVPTDSNIETILDLEGKTIAGLGGSFNLDGPEGIRDLTDQFGIHSTFVEMDSYTEIFKALENNEIDAGITNKDFGNLNEGKYDLERTSIIFQPAHIHFAFTKNAELTPYLINIIDPRLKALKEDKDSYYYQILDTYLGEKAFGDVTPVLPVWAQRALITGGGIILFLLAVGITSSVQVRRRTTELRESESRYRELVDNSLVGIYITQQHVMQFCNQGLADLFGYASPEELLGMSIRDLVTPETWPKVDEEVRLRESGRKQTSRYQFQGVRADGDIFDAEVLGVAVRYRGQPAVQGVLIDITGRVRADAALKNAHQELKELEKIVVHSPAIVFLWVNAEGWPVEYVSENVRKLGYEPEDFYHSHLVFSDIVLPDDQERVAEEVAQYTRKGLDEFVQQYRIVTKAGDIRWIDDHTMVRRGADGEITHFQGIITDVTERVEFEKSLQHHMQRLETIQTVTAALSSTLALDEVLRLILEQIKQVLPYDSAAIFLMKEGDLRVVMDQGIQPSVAGTVFPGESELFQEIKRTRKPLVLIDASKDSRFLGWGYTEAIKGWMGVPLLVRGELIGYVTLDNKEAGVYASSDAALVEPFAAQAAQAIENARLHAQVQRHAEELESRVEKRTAELRKLVSAMSGREVRMAELKKVIRKLRAQLQEAGIEPEADDPLTGEEPSSGKG